MVRHDRIGDARAVLAKSVGVGIGRVAVYSSTVTAGDHEYLTLVTQNYTSSTSPRDFTVVLEDSADNSTWASIPGASFTRSTTAVSHGEDLIILDRRKARRYVRASFTTSGTGLQHSVAAVWLLEGDKNQNLITRANVLVV
jgi:hypothetical protein